MPVTYTNRKGVTFTLTQTVTKNGKLRYNFAREPVQGQPVEAVPEGWEIRESVNGIVTLGKATPQLILPEEEATVAAQFQRLPTAHRFMVKTKSETIVIHEKVGADMAELIETLMGRDLLKPERRTGLAALDSRYARFEPVMRFILVDEEKRKFAAERMSYRGHANHWIDIGGIESLQILAEKYVPALGTDEFFELW